MGLTGGAIVARFPTDGANDNNGGNSHTNNAGNGICREFQDPHCRNEIILMLAWT